MKTEEEIDRYIRCMERDLGIGSDQLTKAMDVAAMYAAKWVLGLHPDPPGYAALLAQDKEDDKRMDR